MSSLCHNSFFLLYCVGTSRQSDPSGKEGKTLLYRLGGKPDEPLDRNGARKHDEYPASCVFLRWILSDVFNQREDVSF
jgi:hypothetical protein